MFGKKKQKQVDQVQVYDFDRQELFSIPADKLAPGMVRVKMQGIDGDVWVEPSGIQMGEYQHPPFSPEIREILGNIQSALEDVYSNTLEGWEDGFRRDHHPEKEIAIWMHIAQVYSSLVPDRAISPDHKTDIFRVVLSCANNPREHVLSAVALTSLSQPEAEQVVSTFFRPEEVDKA